MKKINDLKLTICILILLLLVLSACQHHGDRRRSEFGHPERLADHIVSELDLNSKQKILLNGIVSNVEETRKEIGGRDELEHILVSQLKSDNLDKEYLRRESARVISELESAMDKFISDLASLHASLNKEQMQKLSEFAGSEKYNTNHHN